MSKPASDPEHATRRAVPVWLKALVFFHIFAITVWALPLPSEAVRSGKAQPRGAGWILYLNDRFLKSLGPIQAYLFSTGAWQYWDMFSPNPANVDLYGAATVTFADQTKRFYQYPRMALLPLPQKYVRERYRKYYERASQDANSFLWPAFAQRIALLNANDPRNPPVTVRLRRYFLTVSPPGTPQPRDYSSYNYFEYIVDLPKLRKDKGWRR